MYYFPSIYHNEYLYSAILRYDRHIGNNDLQISFKELFNNGSKISLHREKINYFNSRFQRTLKLSIHELLYKNTNIVLSIPFDKGILMYPHKEYLMKFIFPPSIKKFSLGIENSESSIHCLKYCIDCFKEDFNNYGETYYHLDHQYEGNYFCKKHSSLLKIAMPTDHNSNLPNFSFDNNNSVDLHIKSDRQYIELAKLALDIQLLASNPKYYLDIFNKLRTYNELLIKKGYGFPRSKYIKQQKLYSDFIEIFTKETLELLDLYPYIEKEYDWLKRITRNLIYTYKPDLNHVPHLMLIRFMKNINKDKRKKEIEKRLYRVID